MAFQQQPTGGRCRDSDVDMTSMVDVTFLLLIFFMVTASFNLQKSIAVPPQRSDAGSHTYDVEKEKVDVQVDEHGAFLVMTPHWELETPGKQKLIATLNQAAAESGEGLQLSILVHESAKLESLVDVLDAGASAGFAEIRVTQVEQF